MEFRQSVTVKGGARSASTTISLSSLMKSISVFGAGHLRQFLIPHSNASSRYSMSISSSVSMCSETKEMGTTTRFFTPCSPESDE
jgi:hypothetical protein